jgi:hypothetical protein
VRNDGPAEVEYAGQIDGDVALPVFICLLPNVGGRAGDARIVYQDVDLPRLLQDLLHGPGNRGCIRNVGFDGKRAIGKSGSDSLRSG